MFLCQAPFPLQLCNSEPVCLLHVQLYDGLKRALFSVRTQELIGKPDVTVDENTVGT